MTGGYVPLSVAEVASESDKLVKESTLTGIVNTASVALSTDYMSKITALDFTELSVEAGETIKTVAQDDGQISV